MNTFNKLALPAAIIAGLAVIGPLMNSQQSTVRAAAGPTVSIDPTQLPLPVQGSLGVSGTVAARQSGAWNVGLTGTPNVNISNSVFAPAPTQDVTKSASLIINLACPLSQSPICHDGVQLLPYIVPAGEILVVTSVDIETMAPLPLSLGTVLIPPPNSNSTMYSSWTLPLDHMTHSFVYPNGILFPGSFKFDQISSFNIQQMFLRGYVTLM